MLDAAVKQAKDWAKAHGDNTLILVTSDHSHAVSVVGTVNDEEPGSELRDKVQTYAEAGFPNYPAPDAQGYPGKVDVSRRVFMTFGAYPDHYETLRPFMDGEFVPTIRNAEGVMVANEKYKTVAGAVLREGNLPNKGARGTNSGVHSGDDVVLTATGPGADKVHGQMENTDLFRIMADALALAPQESGAVAKARKK